MQIEAIRAHPGSAHVMVYGTRRNPSCCMRGITTAPRACFSPAMARDTGGLETGAPELGQFPHHHPKVSQSSQRRIFQRKSLLLFQGYTNPATSKPHWLLGYERRRKASLGAAPKPFSPPSHKVSPQQGIASLWHSGPSGCALLNSKERGKAKHPKFPALGLKSTEKSPPHQPQPHLGRSRGWWWLHPLPALHLPRATCRSAGTRHGSVNQAGLP